MARKVRLTKKSDKKLDEIIAYLQDEFGVSTVDKFLDRLNSFFNVIIDFPEIGRLEDSNKKIYGFVLEKPVSVFYRYNDKEVIILNFFDNRMNPKRPKI